MSAMTMTRRQQQTAACLCALFSSACNSPVEVASDPTMNATVSGAMSGSVTGAPLWHVGSHPNGASIFQMNVNDDEADFTLSWTRTGKPVVGIVPIRISNGERIILTHRTTNRRFVADSGSVTITKWISSSDASGTVDIAAFQYCPVPLRETNCDLPGSTITAAARIQIRGTFRMRKESDSFGVVDR